MKDKPLTAKIVCIKPNEETIFLGAIPGLAAPILSRLLDNAGINVEIVDETQKEANTTELRNTDLVLLTYYTNNAPRAYTIAKHLADGVDSKKPIIIMGGPHATFMPKEALDNYADIVVRGLADETVPELMQTLINKSSLEKIKGISYNENTNSRHNVDRNIPAIENMPIPLFKATKEIINPYTRHPLQLSRGCYKRCDFCQIQAVMPIQQSIPIDTLTEIMSELQEDYTRNIFREIDHTKRIFIVDDNFGSATVRSQTVEQLEYIANLGLNLRLTTQARVELGFDSELLKLFYDAGGRRIILGIESMNDESLREMCKGTNRNKIIEAIHGFKSHNLELNGLFVAGYDHDTLEIVRKIPSYAESLGLDSFNISILTPLPGTRLYSRMEKEGRIEKSGTDWSHYDYRTCVFEPKQIPSLELERTVRDIMREHPLSIYAYAKRF